MSDGGYDIRGKWEDLFVTRLSNTDNIVYVFHNLS
jgi:hypothetical protein